MRPPTITLVTIFSAAALAAQSPTVPDDVTITLERTACLGECPIYRVSIDAKGHVVYDGARFVRVTGRQTDRVPVSRVAAILERAERLRFFELKDHYLEIQYPDGSSSKVFDLPSTFVTITKGGRTKRVEDYVGAPEGLADLERLIDEVAHTQQWVSLDEETRTRR